MSELRKDPLVNRWVVITPERRPAPADFHHAAASAQTSCPLCLGREGETPTQIFAAPGVDGWSVRVIPNTVPVLRVEGQLVRRQEGACEAMTGVGAHEIIVETPRHDAELSELTAEEICNVLWTWSERLRDLSQDVRLLSASVFHNRGADAGARLEHSHSQLIALPVIAPRLAAELSGGASYLQTHGGCGHCELLRLETDNGPRLVRANEQAVAIAPWASATPFEVVIVPRAHASAFEREPRDVIDGVAALLREVLRRLNVALERPAYSLSLQTAPLRSDPLGHFHWSLRIVPSFARPGGFEQASGCASNPVPPEEAAAFLRGLRDE